MAMASFLVLPLAGFILASGAGIGTTTPPTQQFASSQSASAAIGRVLGAAASCKEIGSTRLDRAANKLSAVVDSMAKDADELSAVHRSFLSGVIAGGDAVDRGSTSCAEARAALAHMERNLGR